MKIFIPAKSTSKRVQRKNLRPLNDQYNLLEWSIAKYSHWFPDAEIVVATEDQEIKETAERMKCSHYPLTQDDVEDKRNASELFTDYLNETQDRPIVLIDICFPFTFRSEIRNALRDTRFFLQSAVVKPLFFPSETRLSQNIKPSICFTANFLIQKSKEVRDWKEWPIEENAFPVSYLSGMDCDCMEDYEVIHHLFQRLRIQIGDFDQ